MLRAHLHVEKQTVDNKIVTVIDQPSRSFLLQFASLMARQWAQTQDTCKDTAGQSCNEDDVACPFHMTSVGGYGRGFYVGTDSVCDEFSADEQGIVIGTDSASVQPDQYAMVSQIRSGETSGKIMYCGTYLYGLTINPTTDEAHFHVEALFKNMSGDSININEIGIYANGSSENDDFPNIQNYCILRDVVTTVTIADGEYLRVTYTISIAT